MRRDELIDLYDEACKRGLINKNIKREHKTFREICRLCGFPNPYTKQIDFFHWAFREGPRMLLGSRGIGKTDYAVIAGCIYYIYNNDDSIMLFTQNKDRSQQICQEIALGLKKLGVYLIVDNKTRFRTNTIKGKEDSFLSLTIKSLGKRGHHPIRAIFEDPVTPETTNAAERYKTKIAYEEVLKLTQNILIVGQPVHKLDLYNELRGRIETKEIWHGEIPELDPNLDVLRKAGVSEESIQASYFGKIINQAMLSFDEINFIEKFPLTGAVAFIDPSFKGGDYTAVTIMTHYFSGVAIVGFCYKKSWDNCIDLIVEKFKKYKVGATGFECNSLGGVPAKLLGPELSHLNIQLHEITSKDNKHQRIMLAGTFAKSMHLSQESDNEYIKQVVEYEDGVKNDDAPDSLASCLKFLNLI